jgi:hypothetical protein
MCKKRCLVSHHTLKPQYIKEILCEEQYILSRISTMFYRVLINNIQIQKSKILKGNLKDMTYYTHKHPCTMHPVVYYHGTAAACLPDVTT